MKIVGNLLAVESHDDPASTYAQWDEVAASWLHLAVGNYSGPVVIRYGRPWPVPLEQHREELRHCEVQRGILARELGFEPIMPYGPEAERQFLEHHQAARDVFHLPDLITREDLGYPTDYDGGMSARQVAERLARGWLNHPIDSARWKRYSKTIIPVLEAMGGHPRHFATGPRVGIGAPEKRLTTDEVLQPLILGAILAVAKTTLVTTAMRWGDFGASRWTGLPLATANASGVDYLGWFKNRVGEMLLELCIPDKDDLDSIIKDDVRFVSLDMSSDDEPNDDGIELVAADIMGSPLATARLDESPVARDRRKNDDGLHWPIPSFKRPGAARARRWAAWRTERAPHPRLERPGDIDEVIALMPRGIHFHAYRLGKSKGMVAGRPIVTDATVMAGYCHETCATCNTGRSPSPLKIPKELQFTPGEARVWHYYELGWPIKVIASFLGISAGAVRKHRSTAKAKLEKWQVIGYEATLAQSQSVRPADAGLRPPTNGWKGKLSQIKPSVVRLDKSLTKPEIRRRADADVGRYLSRTVDPASRTANDEQPSGSYRSRSA